MKKLNKLYLSCHFAMVSVTFLISFNIVNLNEQYVGYLLFILLFSSPIIMSRHISFTALQMIGILITNSFVVLIIVIDPIEVGLYGHDPYTTAVPASRTVIEGNDWTDLTDVRSSWPLFYFLVAILVNILNFPLISLAKFIPLYMILGPLFFFTALRNYASLKIAFISAIGLTGLRTFYLFNSKFVDQTLAILLFLLVLIAVSIQDERSYFLSLCGIVSLSLTHHATSFNLILLISIWISIELLSRYNIIPERISVSSPRYPSPRLITTIISGILIAIIFMYYAPTFWQELIYNTIDYIGAPIQTPESNVTDATGLSKTSRLSDTISRFAIPLFGIFAIIGVVGILSKAQSTVWMSGWIIYAGVTGALYTITLFGGKVVGLDPIRLLTFLYLPLIPPSLVFLSHFKNTFGYDSIETAKYLLIIGLIITQIFAIPSHVMYSNPSETSLQEGHFTESQFAASEWSQKYSNLGIVPYEKGVWVSENNTLALLKFFEYYEDSHYLRPRRPPAAASSLHFQEKVYDSGEISLYIVTRRYIINEVIN